MKNLLEKLNTSRKPYQMGDLFELKYGFGLPERDRKNGTVPVYGSSGIVGSHFEPALKKPAIIVGRKGNVGSVFYSPVASYPIDTVYFIDEPNKGFDLKYIYYLLNRVDLPRRGGDSAVPGLGREAVYSLDVEVPDLLDQKKIAEILGAYDAKIENNNLIIKNLEATAQAIFNEWFVKFRFPGYKKVKMAGSELGLIPEGWRVGSVTDVLKRIVVPKMYKEEDLQSKGDIPVYDQSRKGIIGYHNEAISFKASPENPIVIFGDHTCRVQLICQPFSLGPNTIPLAGNNYPAILGYFLVKDSISQREYKRHWNELIGLRFPIPDKKLAEIFGWMLLGMTRESLLLEGENLSLKTSRDQLLKKLI